MNNRDLYINFNEVDDDILERSEIAAVANVIPIRRRLPVVVIAAILALFLMGACAVATIYGDSIQSWFSHYWKSITGDPMSDQHTVLINRLSQEIGLSETVAGITVSVDSATVGETSFFILLRVEGLEFSKKHEYGFDEDRVELAPETIKDTAGPGGYSYRFLGLDADGAVLLLIGYDYIAKDTALEKRPPLKITLSMTNFAQNPGTNQRVLLASGKWSFTFSIDRNKLDIKNLPDAQIVADDYSNLADDYSNMDAISETIVLLTNIKLTNTDLRFQYDRQDGDVFVATRPYQIRVVLNNGQEISAYTGYSNVRQDGNMDCGYIWKIPINLDEVVAVKIKEVTIPVN